MLLGLSSSLRIMFPRRRSLGDLSQEEAIFMKTLSCPDQDVASSSSGVLVGGRRIVVLHRKSSLGLLIVSVLRRSFLEGTFCPPGLLINHKELFDGFKMGRDRVFRVS